LHKTEAMDLDMTAYQRRGVQLLLLAGIVAAATWMIEATSRRMLSAHHAMPLRALALMPAVSAAGDGERLTHVDGCFSCHGSQLTGRVVFAGWLGTRIVAPNLTRLAHGETNAQLAAAIRYGVKRDGTSIVEMPSNQFTKSSDSDVAAIIAYLRTLPARPDAAGKSRWRFGGRMMLVTDLIPLEADLVNRSARGPLRTPTSPLALGHYMTQLHCSGCHGPHLSGETIKGSPSLHFAIQHYSPAAFEHFFRTGDGQIGHGTQTMTGIIRRRFKYLSTGDVDAIYSYLRADGRPT
jgi:cytochrome c553